MHRKLENQAIAMWDVGPKSWQKHRLEHCFSSKGSSAEKLQMHWDSEKNTPEMLVRCWGRNLFPWENSYPTYKAVNYSTKDLDLQNFLVMGIWIIWAKRQRDTIVEYISISSSFHIAADWWDSPSLKKEWKLINEHGIWCKWINWTMVLSSSIWSTVMHRPMAASFRLHLSDHEKSTQDAGPHPDPKKERSHDLMKLEETTYSRASYQYASNL